jgi:hypothetical protein
MTPSSPSAIGKKKRRRGKKEEASTSAATSGVHELKQKKEEGTEGRLTGAGCILLLFLF